MSSFVLAAAFWLSCLPYIYAFYLPGAAPRNYIEGEKVDLFVNALTPMLSGAKSAKIVCTYSLSLSTSQTCNRNLSSIVRDTFAHFYQII
jgi:hypothetical protein